MTDFFIYLAILAGSTYLIRAVPFATLTRKITNRHIGSFLYYIPFSVLAAMTLPGAVYATQNPLSGGLGLLVGGVFAYKGKSLTTVAVVCCITALAVELLLLLLG